MEKLIKLLNEYHLHNTNSIKYVLDKEEDKIYIITDINGFNHEQPINTERIISKKFGFIQWLVEQNKIDLNNEELINLMSELGNRINPLKCLLMVLSIQDEPIEYLNKIIKDIRGNQQKTID